MNKTSQIICLPGNGFQALQLFSSHLRTSCPVQVTYLFCLNEMHQLTAYRKWAGVCAAERCPVFQASYRVTIMQTAEKVGGGGGGGGGGGEGRLLCKCEISSAMVEGGG